MENTMNSRLTNGKAYLSLMTLSLLLLFGCKELNLGIVQEEKDELGVYPVDGNIPLANTQFGFNLFNTIWESEQNQNIFISPFSISIALTMTLNGASDETEQAMVDTLQLQGIPTNSINSSYSQLQHNFQTSDPKVTLSIANSLWGREDIQFLPNFLEQNTQYFNAEISVLDFLDPEALKTINEWVKTNTNNKIDKILDEIDENAVLFLINAIYFKGTWETEFDPSNTRDRNFNISTGNVKMVPMMARTGDYPVYYGEDFQSISLPYGDGKVSMYIFVPTGKSNLTTFLNGLDADSWENWMTQFQERNVDVKIPKFKMEYTAEELNHVLTTLGMGVAFDENRANFSRMASFDSISGNLYIQKVSHKTFIEVNEEGTEAAAVTSVGVGIRSLPPTFAVDRPFFFAIRDNETGTVFFMGTIVDPQQ